MTADSGPPVYYGAVELQQKAQVQNTAEKTKWKRHTWIVPLVHTEIWMSALLGVTQTFFPLLATKRGVQAWKCGLVFSVFKAAMFLASVLGDRMLQWTSPQACYLIGQTGAFIFSVSEASLYWSSGSQSLFLLSLATVLLGGFSVGLYFVSLFSVVTHKFSKNPGLIIFQTSVTARGVVFAVQFASYVFGCTLAAIFCHLQVMAFYAFLGHLLTLTAYFIIGPVILIRLERNLGLVYAAQVLLGVGMSSLFVCAYHQALQRATQLGYPDDITTHGFVSSTVFTFMVSGSIVTDPIAGKLLDAYGYRKATTFMFFLLLTLTPVTFVVWMSSSVKSHYERRKVRANAKGIFEFTRAHYSNK
ncbi:uncharacterized protein LOC119396952 isoform X7 [Rhipicephalus sanguineus]|uniref:uncharacterized protein LOC119396952 isoform X7 n=1 Tax=Rhipicephalus sanguineus TaxID=34632 RepID=UPI0018962587|nr:uncharacterized protein LOC119396952 isoform X7 [Rhipicephalus sanguineus]